MLGHLCENYSLLKAGRTSPGANVGVLPHTSSGRCLEGVRLGYLQLQVMLSALGDLTFEGEECATEEAPAQAQRSKRSQFGTARRIKDKMLTRAKCQVNYLLKFELLGPLPANYSFLQEGGEGMVCASSTHPRLLSRLRWRPASMRLLRWVAWPESSEP